MNESVYERIGEASGYLKLDLKATDAAELAARENWTEEHLKYVADMFFHEKPEGREDSPDTAPAEPTSAQGAKDIPEL